MEKRRKIQNSGGRIEDTTSIVPSNFIECNDDRSVIELRSGEGRKSHGTSPRSGKSMTESQSDTNGMKRIYVLQPRFIFHRFAFIPRFHLRDSGRYPPPYLVAGAVSFHFILFFHSNSIPSPLPTHTNQLETIERREGKRPFRGRIIADADVAFLETSLERRKGTYSVSTKQPGLERTHRDVG